MYNYRFTLKVENHPNWLHLQLKLFSPFDSDNANGGDSNGTTVFVKGFDRSLGEDAVREQLTAAFADCGEVNQVRLPSDRETGELKGIAFIEFATTDAKVTAVPVTM